MIRTLLILIVLLFCSQPAFAQTAEASGLTVADSYEARIFTRRLGRISDMHLGPDGRLYIADAQTGRIFIVDDRSMDGRADMTRSLPHRFDNPTGIATSGDGLFISDANGLWRVGDTGTPALLAPYDKSDSLGSSHPIIMTDNKVVLGLSTRDGRARLLSIDPSTGRAALMSEANGQITVAVRGQQAGPWWVHEKDGRISAGPGLPTSLDLPDGTRSAWLDGLSGHLYFVTEDGLFRTTVSLGRVEDDPLPMLAGFASRPRAEPGSVIGDARGIFLADTDAGIVWLIRQVDEKNIVEPRP